MPIKRLQTEASFPRIGTLRKGAPKTDPKRPGKDLTYFRFDTQDPEAAADFLAVYGPEPASINVYLPYDAPDANFQAWQEEYQAGGLVHRCDGETMTVHLVLGGRYSTDPAPCPYATGEKVRTKDAPGCKPVGRLSVIIPELRRFAYVTVGTTSINDIMELSANLSAAYALRGTLQGIPFILTRRPEKISTPTDAGGRARREKWMLHIEPDPAWVRLQLAGMRRRALQLPEERMLIDGQVVTEDGEIVDGWEDEIPHMARPQLSVKADNPFTDDENPDDLPDTLAEYGEPLNPDPQANGKAQEPPKASAPPVDPKAQKTTHSAPAVGGSEKQTPAAAQEADEEVLRISQADLARLNALGIAYYGKDAWEATERSRLAEWKSKGKAKVASHLTPTEAASLIAGLEKQIAAREAQPAK